MKKIEFYRNIDGKCYIEEFLDSLSGKEAQKVIWTLKVIEELDIAPKQYFKKLKNSEDIWEVRVDGINKTFRILGFFYKQELIILNHAFIKKTQKTPRTAIEIAINRKNEYLRRKKMSDLNKYINNRKKTDKEFAKNFDSGYENFKIGVMLKQAREKSGFTQEQLAVKLKTKKSAISRIENHAEDIRLSTLEKYAKALNFKLNVSLQSN